MSQVITIRLPSNRSRELTVEPMSVGQMTQLFATKNRGKKAMKLLTDKIVPSCAGLADGEFDNFLVGDAAYIFLALRRATYGDELDYSATCSICRAKSSFVTDLKQIEPQFLKPGADGKCKTDGFEFKYNYRGKDLTYVYHLVRVHEQKEAEKLAEKSGEEYPDIDFTLTAALAVSIDDIKGITDGKNPYAKRQAVLENVFHAPLDFLDAFRDAREEVDCGIETSIDQKCPNCEGNFAFELPLLESFFSPEARTLRKERMAKLSKSPTAKSTANFSMAQSEKS